MTFKIYNYNLCSETAIVAENQVKKTGNTLV